MRVWYETNQLMLFYFDQNKISYLHVTSDILDHSTGQKVRIKKKICK